MKIDKWEEGAVTVLLLDGDIDESGVNDLRLRLLECIKGNRTNLVVDMENVGFVSFLGLGVLVERLRQVRKLGGDLRLSKLNSATEKLLRMGGATNVFEKFADRDEAVHSYRKAA